MPLRHGPPAAGVAEVWLHVSTGVMQGARAATGLWTLLACKLSKTVAMINTESPARPPPLPRPLLAEAEGDEPLG